MEAYTYSIKHIPSDKIYYGVRKSNDFDLGRSYFTSSKIVHQLIELDGIDAFEFKLRKKFNSYKEAREYETRILSRLRAPSNPKLLNQAVSSPSTPLKDSFSEQLRRQKISNSMKKLWQDSQYKENQNFNKIPLTERVRRGRKGGLQAAQNIKAGITKKKPYPSKLKRIIIIERRNEQKLVKPYYVAAYQKIGWKRIGYQLY